MHPAAGLRRNEFRDRVVEDFMQLPEIIRRAREEPPEDELKPELPPTSVQRSLF